MAGQGAIDESLIRLVRGEGLFRAPLAVKTARAGDSYMPIPFARSCKITTTGKSLGCAQASTLSSGTVSSLEPWMTMVSCGTASVSY